MIKLDTAITAYLEASYQKIRLLKDTAKSQVWLATDRTGQTVILKRLASTGLPLKALQEADCPLCPKILCYAEDKDGTLLVEEHIAGDSLQHLAAQGKLTEKEATDLLRTVASGLALLHAHGIVHRDIKPANLLREKSGRYRLIDFDAARLMKDAADEDTALLGTKGYAPPEQYGYGQTDARSDLYALGMTVKRLLPEDYRGFLRPIIRKCTAVDPEERYQSAEELEKALRRNLFFHKAKRPLLAACVLLLILLLRFSFLQLQEEVPEQAEDIPTELVKPDSPASAPSENAEATPQTETKTATSQELPTIDNPPTQPSPVPLPALDTTAPHVNTQTSAEAPGQTNQSTSAMPSQPPPLPQGTIKSQLFWQGQATSPASSYKIAPKDWLTGTASLRVVNDSNTTIESNTIQLTYENNYGQKLDAEVSMPALTPGETADIPIPCGTAFPEGAESLSLWVQIRLPRTILPQTETYRCLKLDITQEK